MHFSNFLTEYGLLNTFVEFFLKCLKFVPKFNGESSVKFQSFESTLKSTNKL